MTMLAVRDCHLRCYCAAARAASMAHYVLEFYHMIDRETLEPMLIQSMVPLCMAQYEYMFATTRVPGKEVQPRSHSFLDWLLLCCAVLCCAVRVRCCAVLCCADGGLVSHCAYGLCVCSATHSVTTRHSRRSTLWCSVAACTTPCPFTARTSQAHTAMSL